MIPLGSFKSRDCSGSSRRSFLRFGAALPFLSGTPGVALARDNEKARAKSTIFVWLWGAPSHIDMFDPKPRAPVEFRGPFTPIATRTPGVHFTELLPKLAARSHRFALVRSNISYDGGHPGAGTLGMTGYKEGNRIHPAFGSIVSRHHGETSLPSFLMLGRGIPRDVVRPSKGYGGGEWGKSYDPFLISCNGEGNVNIPALKLLKTLTPDRLQNRRLLSKQLDQIRKSVSDNQFDQWDRIQQQAFDMLTSPSAVKALDLSSETEKTRQMYGQTSFGQSLLLARRLAESEIPYIHVNWSEYVEALTPNCDFGWDTHIHNFDLLPNRHCPIFDRAMSALLDDLHQRGLLATTQVVAMGEFGRTPKISKRASRDHWPQCYFSLWAGAGVKAGRVVGASDSKGARPVTRPIDPADVGTTIMDGMGIDSVARAELNVLPGGKVISELI